MNIAQGHILCTIGRPSRKLEYAAAPLSLIFSTNEASSRRQSETKSHSAKSFASVQSEDVFVHVAQIALPDAIEMTTLPSVRLVSVCTSYWRHPDRQDLDDTAVQTRILIFLRLVLLSKSYYMISQLDFSSTSNSHLSRLPPPVAVANDNEKTEAVVYQFTGQRHSALFPYVVGFPEHARLTCATRTGRVVGSFLDYSSLHQHGKYGRDVMYRRQDPIKPTLCAVDLGSQLGDLDCVPVGHYFARTVHPNISGILSSDDMYVRLGMDEYSGALWYRRGDSVFIHNFD